jgi:hypothetical protein
MPLAWYRLLFVFEIVFKYILKMLHIENLYLLFSDNFNILMLKINIKSEKKYL